MCEISSPFQSSVGCRYGHFYANSVGLIEYQDELIHILDQSTNTLTKNQKDLESILTGDHWNKLKLEIGLPAISWLYLLDQHHKAISSRSNFEHVNEAMQAVEGRCDGIIDGEQTVTEIVQQLLGPEFEISEKAEKALR